MSEQMFNVVTGLLGLVVVPFCWVAIWKWSKRRATEEDG
jgi:hypothetical protein